MAIAILVALLITALLYDGANRQHKLNLQQQQLQLQQQQQEQERKQRKQQREAKAKAEAEAKAEEERAAAALVASVLDYPAFNGTGEEEYRPFARGTVAGAFFMDKGEHLLHVNTSHATIDGFTRTRLLAEERNKGVHIITTFFHGSYGNVRLSEIVSSLTANLENPNISFVHCLWEKENPAYYLGAHPALLRKLVLKEINFQPTYSYMFTYANQNLDRGAVVIVTNADIYFDSSISCVLGPDPKLPVPTKMHERSMYAVSRRPSALCGGKPDHDQIKDLCLKYVHSHDAFIFAVPVPAEILAKTNHVQNKFGAENIIIWEFVEAGFKVWNPCETLLATHLHCSGERQYITDHIDGIGYGAVYRHGMVRPDTVRLNNTWYGLVTSPFVPCLTRMA